jgi:hypothetical protein
MIFRILLLVFIPSIVNAQVISKFEAQDGMCTVILLEANDSCVYRIGIEGLENDHIKKTSHDGKELASRKLHDKKNKIRLRGAYIRNNFIHVLIADDSDGSTKLKLSKLDPDLNLVEEKTIYTGPIIGKGWKAKTYFHANESGFVMVRDYLRNNKVWLSAFIYDFDKKTAYTSDIKFKAPSSQRISDIEFNEDLQLSMITSHFYNLGSHKARYLKNVSSYLIHASYNNALTYLKLNQDKVYSDRSFNAFFNNGVLNIASLKFNEQSNIFEGYFVRSFNRNNSTIKMISEEFYPFEDYAYRDEWGISRSEVIKNYEQDKNRKNTKNSHLSNLHIGDAIALNDDNLLLIIREAQYIPENGFKLFADLQVVNLNMKKNQILWWNRLLNAPLSGKDGGFRMSIGDPLWSPINISSELISITPILKPDTLTLLYGTYKSLYKDKKLIQDKEIRQGMVFGSYIFATKILGRSKLSIDNGDIINDLPFDDEYEKSNFFSFSYMNTEGFCHDMGKVFLLLETPVKWRSIIVSFPL